jgi:hypothetical protein
MDMFSEVSKINLNFLTSNDFNKNYNIIKNVHEELKEYIKNKLHEKNKTKSSIIWKITKERSDDRSGDEYRSSDDENIDEDVKFFEKNYSSLMYYSILDDDIHTENSLYFINMYRRDAKDLDDAKIKLKQIIDIKEKYKGEFKRRTKN